MKRKFTSSYHPTRLRSRIMPLHESKCHSSAKREVLTALKPTLNGKAQGRGLFKEEKYLLSSFHLQPTVGRWRSIKCIL